LISAPVKEHATKVEAQILKMQALAKKYFLLPPAGDLYLAAETVRYIH
jgi:hypothetical protein